MSKRRILIFGESENDTKALKEFIEALCDGFEGSVETRRRPLVLIKDARPENVRSQAEQIARVVAAETQVGPVICVFAHKDGDVVEPGHTAVATLIEQAVRGALRRLNVSSCSVHAVVPAWELENWLLLWPSVLGSYVPSWRTPDEYKNRNVGKIENGKEVLRAAVRPPADRSSKRGKSRTRVREYKESDAPGIVKAIREKGLIGSPDGTSRSYDRFVASVEECCAA